MESYQKVLTVSKYLAKRLYRFLVFIYNQILCYMMF